MVTHKNMATGFLFAFKLYMKNNGDSEMVDCLENLVHFLTSSDLIHVEIIPVTGGAFAPTYENSIFMEDGSYLIASDVAYTAYVGKGYNKHHSRYCIRDESYTHLFVPLSPLEMDLGLSFLESLQGKHYNYAALPLTILPESYKFKTIHSLYSCLSPPKVFCSQMGLLLCYLCDILRPEDHDTQHGKAVIFDPKCCTPADLHRILITSNADVHYCVPQQIILEHELL